MKKLDPLKVSLARTLAANGEAARIREAARLSRHEVAAHLGTSATTVRRWEKGERKPTGPLGAAYADLLGALRSLVP